MHDIVALASDDQHRAEIALFDKLGRQIREDSQSYPPATA
jgi:hypothetical protein